MPRGGDALGGNGACDQMRNVTTYLWGAARAPAAAAAPRPARPPRPRPPPGRAASTPAARDPVALPAVAPRPPARALRRRAAQTAVDRAPYGPASRVPSVSDAARTPHRATHARPNSLAPAPGDCGDIVALSTPDLKKIVGKGEVKAWSRSDLKWIVQGATYHSALLLGIGIGALIMLALCIACIYRRRKKRAGHNASAKN